MNRPEQSPNHEQWIQDAFAENTIDPATANHPDETLLLDYVYEQLEANDMARLSSHIAKCAFCTQQVETLRNELQQAESTFSNVLPMTQESTSTAFETDQATTPSSSLVRKFFAWMDDVLGNRKAFVGHAITYAAAGAALVVVFVGTIADPLQSTSGPSVLNWILRFFGVAWLVYFPFLVLHGWKSRKKK